MKYFITLLIVIFTFSSCRNESDVDEVPAVNEDQLEEVAYLNYGTSFEPTNLVDSNDLSKLYSTLRATDTVDIQIRTKINEVCTKKGCWIQIPIGEDQSARVTFKNYGFFLPKNSQGKKVILTGKAFKSVTSVADAQHYAMDNGQSQEEIDAITEDQETFSFIADGALVEAYDNPDVYVAEPASEK